MDFFMRCRGLGPGLGTKPIPGDWKMAMVRFTLAPLDFVSPMTLYSLYNSLSDDPREASVDDINGFRFQVDPWLPRCGDFFRSMLAATRL